MEVKFKKLHENAVLPSYAKPGDAGLDLIAVDYKYSKSLNQIEYLTGIAIELPEGFVGLIFPRSSIRDRALRLSNCVGVIDSGYRGEIKFTFDRWPSLMSEYQNGEKIGQLIIIPYPQIEPVWSEELSETERGTGGFGSTGI